MSYDGRMRILLCLVMLGGFAIAEEAPVNAIAPRSTSCKPNGAVWFELEYVDSTPKAARSAVKIYANGATTITHKREANETVRNARCIPAREMLYIEGLLKKAPWKVTRPKNTATCMATSTESTVVKVFGKTVFTEVVCSAAVLDAKSVKNLAELKTMIPANVRTECLENPLAKGCN